MNRFATLAVGGTAALSLTLGSLVPATAAPLPAQSAVQVGGHDIVENVRWRRGYGGRAAGALAAGAALGIIGGAIAASAAPRYGYGGYPAYGYGGYPAYGYGGYPAYGYGYAPVRGYGYGGYPAYGGYYGYGY